MDNVLHQWGARSHPEQTSASASPSVSRITSRGSHRHRPARARRCSAYITHHASMYVLASWRPGVRDGDSGACLHCAACWSSVYVWTARPQGMITVQSLARCPLPAARDFQWNARKPLAYIDITGAARMCVCVREALKAQGGPRSV